MNGFKMSHYFKTFILLTLPNFPFKNQHDKKIINQQKHIYCVGKLISFKNEINMQENI